MTEAEPSGGRVNDKASGDLMWVECHCLTHCVGGGGVQLEAWPHWCFPPLVTVSSSLLPNDWRLARDNVRVVTALSGLQGNLQAEMFVTTLRYNFHLCHNLRTPFPMMLCFDLVIQMTSLICRAQAPLSSRLSSLAPASHRCGPSSIPGLGRGRMCEKFHQLLAVGRWFPPGIPVSSTR